jgi:hypothetical protein
MLVLPIIFIQIQTLDLRVMSSGPKTGGLERLALSCSHPDGLQFTRN